jgi:Glycosyl hydrolases family 39
MRIAKCLVVAVAAILSVSPAIWSQQTTSEPATVTTRWDDVTAVSATVPTTQILAHAYTLRSSPIHDALFKALEDLHTNDTRLQSWYSVTRQAVLEIKEPTATETFWDFQYADPLVEDYYAHTSGRHHLNFTTIPRWMFKVPAKEVPDDPTASFYPYTDDTRGDLLKDPSGRQIAEYQARIFQWYTKGGFRDELGKFHKSGHHYGIDYWDVLNEPDFENKITVEQYTKIYDAVTEAIHKIDPSVQLFGPEVSGAEVPWARYFLNPKNHKPRSLPVNWFTFHNYVNAPNDPSTWHAKYFTDPARSATDGASARVFVDRILEVLKIRDELSPNTKVIVDELGTFNDVKTTEEACRANEPYQTYNPLYWNAIGANWAYIFIAAERLKMPMFSMSQMIGYPTQCPSISMFDKDTAKPNAHYWVLSLINRNFGPGDKLVTTKVSSSQDIEAQAAITKTGRKLLLVNTTEHSIQVNLAESFSGTKANPLQANVVDQASGEEAPRADHLTGQQITLAPFAVAVVSGSNR